MAAEEFGYRKDADVEKDSSTVSFRRFALGTRLECVPQIHAGLAHGYLAQADVDARRGPAVGMVHGLHGGQRVDAALVWHGEPIMRIAAG